MIRAAQYKHEIDTRNLTPGITEQQFNDYFDSCTTKPEAMNASREMTLEEYIAALHPNHSAVTEMHRLFQVSTEQSALIAELEAERDTLQAECAENWQKYVDANEALIDAQAENRALRNDADRLARLVEAAGKALNADKRMNKPPNTIMRAEMLVDCQRAAIAELRQALSAVLGEETK